MDIYIFPHNYIHIGSCTQYHSRYIDKYNHLLNYCSIAFLSSKKKFKVKRLIPCCHTSLGHTVGFIIPPPPAPTVSSSQLNSRVINNTPSITLYTQMGRQVEGWWRAARRVVFHPVIQIRLWTRDSASPTPPHPTPHYTFYPTASRDLYPSSILLPLPMQFVTAGPLWRLLLKENRHMESCTRLPSDLWSAGVSSRWYCFFAQGVSEVVRTLLLRLSKSFKSLL